MGIHTHIPKCTAFASFWQDVPKVNLSFSLLNIECPMNKFLPKYANFGFQAMVSISLHSLSEWNKTDWTQQSNPKAAMMPLATGGKSTFVVATLGVLGTSLTAHTSFSMISGHFTPHDVLLPHTDNFCLFTLNRHWHTPVFFVYPALHLDVLVTFIVIN